MGSKLFLAVLWTSILLNDTAGRWPFLGAHHQPLVRAQCPMSGEHAKSTCFSQEIQFGGEHIAGIIRRQTPCFFHLTEPKFIIWKDTWQEAEQHLFPKAAWNVEWHLVKRGSSIPAIKGHGRRTCEHILCKYDPNLFLLTWHILDWLSALWNWSTLRVLKIWNPLNVCKSRMVNIWRPCWCRWSEAEFTFSWTHFAKMDTRNPTFLVSGHISVIPLLARPLSSTWESQCTSSALRLRDPATNPTPHSDNILNLIFKKYSMQKYSIHTLYIYHKI